VSLTGFGRIGDTKVNRSEGALRFPGDMIGSDETVSDSVDLIAPICLFWTGSCDNILEEAEREGEGEGEGEGAGDVGRKARGRMEMRERGFTVFMRERGFEGCGTIARLRMDVDDVCFPILIDPDCDADVTDKEGEGRGGDRDESRMILDGCEDDDDDDEAGRRCGDIVEREEE